MEPYIPIYKRGANKLLEYIERPFDDGYGHSGIERVAVFKDKKGNIQEMTIQVRWNNK